MGYFDFLFKKKKREEERHDLLGKRQREQGVLEDGARLLKEIISSCDGRGCYPFRIFSSKEIENAIERLYHKEGLYNDYEGTHDGRQIIIKVYRSTRENAFNEIAMATQINHGNVVKLLGCCFEMEWPILIYERVPFILRSRLFEANPSSLIPWEHRLRIAIEVAYAITYLHIGTSRPIVHRDIKCSNILLDENYKPKLADFSLSITIPLGETHVETEPAGTHGFIDPEYLSTNLVSEKSDVYSYGVVLLELLSGKKHRELLEMAMDLPEQEDIDPISPEQEDIDPISPEQEDIDPISPVLNFMERKIAQRSHEWILGNGLSMNDRELDQAIACMELVGRCMKYNRDERPSMKDVTQQLLQIERAELPSPSSSSSMLPVQQLSKYKLE